MGTRFNAPSTAVPRSKDIPVWDAKINQWVPQTAPKASINGVVVSAPVIQAAANNVTSTGAIGAYTITFPAAFATAPIVVPWCAKDSFGNPVLLNLRGVSVSSFQVDMTISTSGAAVNVGQVILIEWIAIGT